MGGSIEEVFESANEGITVVMDDVVLALQTFVKITEDYQHTVSTGIHGIGEALEQKIQKGNESTDK